MFYFYLPPLTDSKEERGSDGLVILFLKSLHMFPFKDRHISPSFLAHCTFIHILILSWFRN